MSAMSLIFVGLAVMVAGASAQTPFDSTFPFCDCVRPTGPSSSPYLLTPTTSVASPDGTTKVCWALTARSDATGPCAKFDLKKIELNINTGCRAAVKSITFGTNTMSASYASYPKADSLVMKITKGTSNLATLDSLVGKTTPVCVVLKSPSADNKCNTLPTFCRDGKCEYAYFSPNNRCCPGQATALTPITVPVPIPGFPYCECDRTTPFNSFSMSPSGSAPVPTTAGGRNTFCWTLNAARYSGSATNCVNYDLKKIEWAINSGCQGAVSSITLDGEKIAASYQRYPAKNATVFKITRGRTALASLSNLVAKPARVCIELGGSCPTLSSFCSTPTCQISYFSPDNNCCPLANLATRS